MFNPTDRRLNWLLGLVIFTTAAILVFAFFVVPTIYRSKSISESSARTNELDSCRDEAAIEVERLDVIADDADRKVDAKMLEGLAALAHSSGAELDLAVKESLEAQREAEDRGAEVLAAMDRYIDQITLSREDPERFLKECKAG